MADSEGNVVNRLLRSIDRFQQRHRPTAFLYAVIKKYGDDEAGFQGALITYYGFLSIFPLLIVMTSILQLTLRHDSTLKLKILSGFDHYFPIIGNQLEGNVHGLSKTGGALAIGLLLTLYGARGGANALQHALDHVWQVPKVRRVGFPKALLKNMVIIFVGGGGLLLAAIASGFATSLGHSVIFHILAIVISLALTCGVLLFIFKHGVSKSAHIGYQDVLPSAVGGAIAMLVLQALGGYLVTHQLHSLRDLYGTFAVVLGLLFWIYLQAQVMLYVVEISSVRKLGLWPRSITPELMTKQDLRAYKMYAQKETYHDPEKVAVEFQKRKI